MIIQLFIHLHADLNNQRPITESARIQIRAIWQHRTQQIRNNKNRKINQFMLLIFKHEFLKMSVSLQTEFTFETHLAERQ